MFTRRDYCPDNKCTHEQYFTQFVTPKIKAAVRSYFGVARLLASTDPHLNDIALSKWDMFCGYNQFRNELRPNLCFASIIPLLKQANGDGGCSPSDFTCIAKQAAREIIREEWAKQFDAKES